MSSFYIGRCPKCGVIKAATLSGLRDTARNLKDMIDGGLKVETSQTDTVRLEPCGCSKTEPSDPPRDDQRDRDRAELNGPRTEAERKYYGGV